MIRTRMPIMVKVIVVVIMIASMTIVTTSVIMMTASLIGVLHGVFVQMPKTGGSRNRNLQDASIYVALGALFF